MLFSTDFLILWMNPCVLFYSKFPSDSWFLILKSKAWCLRVFKGIAAAVLAPPISLYSCHFRTQQPSFYQHIHFSAWELCPAGSAKELTAPFPNIPQPITGAIFHWLLDFAQWVSVPFSFVPGWIVAVPSICHPHIILQINHLHFNPGLKLCFWRNPKEDTWLPQSASPVMLVEGNYI